MSPMERSSLTIGSFPTNDLRRANMTHLNPGSGAKRRIAPSGPDGRLVNLLVIILDLPDDDRFRKSGDAMHARRHRKRFAVGAVVQHVPQRIRKLSGF